MLICGTHTIITAEGEAEEVPSWFNLAGINAKLEQFPRFARAYGKSAVRSCGDAEACVTAYAEFSARNPGFELDQAFIERRPPPLPDATLPEVSEVKVVPASGSLDAPCGRLTSAGRCFGERAVWCDDGSTGAAQCELEAPCGWDMGAGGFRCVRAERDPCRGVDSFGLCRNDEALRCDEGTLKSEDCGACSVVPGDGHATCIDERR